ncbi:MAG: hypothetical protein WC307_02910 [Candidatus Nanoarchaeia archaeon]|jgi:hypothetical protein
MKAFTIILLLSLLLMPSIVQAQSGYQYGFFERFIDGFRLFFSDGDARVNLLLKINDKEINSAVTNLNDNNTVQANNSVNNALQNLQTIQSIVTLNTTTQVKARVNQTISQLSNQTFFDELVNEATTTSLTTDLTNRTYEYCKELAIEDYNIMLMEAQCNPATAQIGLRSDLESLRQLHAESFNKLMLEIRSCIDDPGTCNCDSITDVNEKNKCERMIVLAIRCEYDDNETACSEIESMRPAVESFVPEFLLNLFNQQSSMIEYDVEKSDVPPECYNENNKTECEQYRGLKEINGQQSTPENRTPTMQESIPQCYDESGQFIESCGKITIVWRNGLINYLIEQELNMTIETLTNQSMQHTIDINGTIGQIKQEMMQLNETISLRVFAPGTNATSSTGTIINGTSGSTSVVVEGNGTSGSAGLVIEGGSTVVEGGGTGSLTPEVSTVVVEGDGAGDSAGVVVETN